MNIFIDLFLIAVIGYFGWFGLLVILATSFPNANEKKIATLSAWIMAAGCVIFFLDKNGFLSIL
jgi:hypothetical protein